MINKLLLCASIIGLSALSLPVNAADKDMTQQNRLDLMPDATTEATFEKALESGNFSTVQNIASNSRLLNKLMSKIKESPRVVRFMARFGAKLGKYAFEKLIKSMDERGIENLKNPDEIFDTMNISKQLGVDFPKTLYDQGLKLKGLAGDLKAQAKYLQDISLSKVDNKLDECLAFLEATQYKFAEYDDEKLVAQVADTLYNHKYIDAAKKLLLKLQALGRLNPSAEITTYIREKNPELWREVFSDN